MVILSDRHSTETCPFLSPTPIGSAPPKLPTQFFLLYCFRTALPQRCKARQLLSFARSFDSQLSPVNSWIDLLVVSGLSMSQCNQPLITGASVLPRFHPSQSLYVLNRITFFHNLENARCLDSPPLLAVFSPPLRLPLPYLPLVLRPPRVGFLLFNLLCT